MSNTVNMKDILLVGDKVLLKQITPEETSPGGLYIGPAEQVDNIYEVIAVGPGLKDKPMTVKVGDQVVVPLRPMGQAVVINDFNYIVLKEFEIPVIVRKSDEKSDS